MQTDGKVVVGGDFTSIASQGTNYLVRLIADGTFDAKFSGSADGEVMCLAIQPDGKILVGGVFQNLAGQACTNLGRLNTDGTLDTNFVAAPNGYVQALAVQADGTVLFGGNFGSVNGTPCSNLGRLKADTTLDPAFAPDPDQMVNSLAVQPDGKIVVGGDFTTLAGQASLRLGRLNPDGTLDSAFAPNPDNSVLAVTVQSDGKILVGGAFTQLAGQARSNLGRVNSDGTLDATFNPRPDSIVFTLALQADGNIVAGGNFQNLAGRPTRFIGRLTPSGSLDPTFSINANGGVGALAIQSDGKIIVAGGFALLGSQVRPYLGRLSNPTPPTQSISSDGKSITWLRGGSSPEVWRTTFERLSGTNWVNLGAGTRITNGWILANITMPPNSPLRARGFVAGASLNGSGWFVETTSVAPTITGLSGGSTNLPGTSATFTVQAAGTPVLSYQWRKNGINLRDGGSVSGSLTPTLTLTNISGADRAAYTVVVSSPFGSVTSAAVNLAVLDPYILTQPASLTNNAGTPAAFSVSALGTAPITCQWRRNGTNLVEGGNASGTQTPTLTLSSVFGADAGPYTVVLSGPYSKVVSSNATLSVIDPFITLQPAGTNVDVGQEADLSVTVAGTAPLKFQWRKNGTNIASATVSAFSLTNAQRANIANYNVVITNVFGKTTSAVALLTVNLATVDAWNPGADGAVSAVAQQPDGKVLIGGQFTMLGGQPRLGLGRLRTDGSPDAGFTPGTDGEVTALTVQMDGKILVGGDFMNLAGAPRSFLGRVDAAGSPDDAFNPNVNGIVRALALQADGKILVGGEFTAVGGSQTNGFLARLNGDGTLDTTFNPAPNNSVLALAVQLDGKIVAGGLFTGLGGQTRNRIGRLNADGSLDAGFDPGADSWVYCLAVQPDGKILVGGVFNTLGGQTRLCAGRVNADGSLDAGFNPNANNIVCCLAPQVDGKVILGGSFTTLAGQSHKFIGRVNTNGSLDGTFGPGADSPIATLALQSDGTLLAGGQFSLLNEQPRAYVGRLLPTDPATDFLQFDGSTITWVRTGTCPEAWHTTFETYVADTGWVDLGATARITNGWQLAGLGLSRDAQIRTRAYIAGSGSSFWFVERSQPTLVLTPPAILHDAAFGFQANQFAFNVTGSLGQSVVIQASTNLVDWTVLTNFTLGSGPFLFTDPNAPGFPIRFYRLTQP